MAFIAKIKTAFKWLISQKTMKMPTGTSRIGYIRLRGGIIFSDLNAPRSNNNESNLELQKTCVRAFIIHIINDEVAKKYFFVLIEIKIEYLA